MVTNRASLRHWRRIKPKVRERLRSANRVKLRHLCLGTKGRLHPRDQTLRKLHEWAFLFISEIFACELGSVGIHREFITAAARWIMEAKLWSVLSARMAIRLNSFSLPKKFSIRCRHLYISSSMARGIARRGCWEMTALAPRASISAMMALLSNALSAM